MCSNAISWRRELLAGKRHLIKEMEVDNGPYEGWIALIELIIATDRVIGDTIQP